MQGKPMEYWAGLCMRYQPIIDLFMNEMSRRKVPAEEGSELLAFLAGMSRGIQGLSAIDLSEAIARGYQIGAMEG